VLIFYTNKFIPDNDLSACTRGFFIFIRPEFKNNIGLLEHEKYHRKQFIKTFGLSSILYKFSKSYRLKSEIKAYKVQLSYNKPEEIEAKRKLYAKYISEDYNLNIMFGKVYELLK